MGRAKQLFDTYWQYYDLKPDFEETDKEERTQWYRVACEEARLAEYSATSQIAQDASVVLGLLESMIDANPDMQTDDYRDSQKQRRDEAERVRREAVVAQMWRLTLLTHEELTMIDRAITLYSVFNQHQSPAIPYELLTAKQKRGWEAVAEFMATDRGKIRVMENINNDLRDALWVVMRNAAKALDVEINIVDP